MSVDTTMAHPMEGLVLGPLGRRGSGPAQLPGRPGRPEPRRAHSGELLIARDTASVIGAGPSPLARPVSQGIGRTPGNGAGTRGS